jgi:hypothetical protein
MNSWPRALSDKHEGRSGRAASCKVVGSVCLSRDAYGFGEVRVATLALLIFTALSG